MNPDPSTTDSTPNGADDRDGGVESLARINPAYRPRLRGVAHFGTTPRHVRRRPRRMPPSGTIAGTEAGSSRGVPGLQALTTRLTSRDRWLLWMLLEHRVLTSTQVSDLAFGSRRMATARLATLHEMGVVDRFRPSTVTGSAPHHVVLAPRGADVLAGDLDTTVDALDYAPQRLARLAVSLHLAHDVGANGVFTALARQARLAFGERAWLRAWWSERRCHEAWDGVVRPDGYGRWREQQPDGHQVGPVEVDFFLEYDTGSENLARVVAKLHGYAALAASSGIHTPVLFWLPTPGRERHLRAAITGWLSARPAAAEQVPIATTSGRSDDGRVLAGPADAIWLPIPTSVARAPSRIPLIALSGHGSSPVGSAKEILPHRVSLTPDGGYPGQQRPVGTLGPRHLQAPPPSPPAADLLAHTGSGAR